MRGMSWPLRPSRRKVADLQQMPHSTMRTKARFVGLRAISCRAIDCRAIDCRAIDCRAIDCRAIGILAAFDPAGCRRAVEPPELAYARDLLAVGRMPQPEVPNLVQPLRQDVLEELTHEFVPRHAAGPPLVQSPVLVPDRDRPIVKVDDAGVGDGDAKDVAGEVIQDALLTLAPRRALGDPGFGPGGVGDRQIRAALLERGTQLPTNEFGESLHWNQERLPRRMPILAIVGDAAAGDEAVHVRVVVKLLGPGVQDGEDADGA